MDTAYYSESGWDTAHNITCYSESGGDTAQENVFRYSHWGGDTAHNTTYYLESGGGDTAQENVFRCSHWGGDTAQNSKKEGGEHRTNQSRLLAGWVAGSMIIVPILAPSCKLKLARFSAELRIQDGAE